MLTHCFPTLAPRLTCSSIVSEAVGNWLAFPWINRVKRTRCLWKLNPFVLYLRIPSWFTATPLAAEMGKIATWLLLSLIDCAASAERELTDNSILLHSVQQASGELLNVQSKAGTIFHLPQEFDQHVGRHREAIIALENVASAVALLQVGCDARLCIQWRVVLRQACTQAQKY